MTIVEWKKHCAILAKKGNELQEILVSSHPVVKFSTQKLNMSWQFFLLRQLPCSTVVTRVNTISF